MMPALCRLIYTASLSMHITLGIKPEQVIKGAVMYTAQTLSIPMLNDVAELHLNALVQGTRVQPFWLNMHQKM